MNTGITKTNDGDVLVPDESPWLEKMLVKAYSPKQKHTACFKLLLKLNAQFFRRTFFNWQSSKETAKKRQFISNKTSKLESGLGF